MSLWALLWLAACGSATTRPDAREDPRDAGVVGDAAAVDAWIPVVDDASAGGDADVDSDADAGVAVEAGTACGCVGPSGRLRSGTGTLHGRFGRR